MDVWQVNGHMEMAFFKKRNQARRAGDILFEKNPGIDKLVTLASEISDKTNLQPWKSQFSFN